MIAFRSILFNTAFYANLILRMIVLSPIYFLLPRKRAYFTG
jgi:1-acyl-sn-glycerol-3-phosphate acyltransferase